MFDIGWSELLLIGVVALIVVGPKDLPGMFRTLGRLTAKARAMGREFSRAMEDAANESGIKDAASNLNDLKGLASKKSLGLDALEKATDKFEKWEPKLASVSPASKTPSTDELAGEPEPRKPAKKAPAKPAVKKAPAQKAAKPAATKPATPKKAAPRKPAAKKGDA